MESSVCELTLDLQQSYTPQTVTVKTGDTRRALRLRLTDGGNAYPLTGDCYGVFTAQKPDGTSVFNHCTREKDVFCYTLTPQTTAVAGVFPCELRLYGENEALLTSAAFTLRVEPQVCRESEVTSAGEATALTRLVGQVQELLALMENGEIAQGVLTQSAKEEIAGIVMQDCIDPLEAYITESGVLE